jgi:hypothetical protein
MLTSWRFARSAVLASSMLATLAMCDPARDAGRRTDTTLPPSVGAVESLSAGEAMRRWERSAGTVLLVRDDSLTRAIYPMLRELDSTAVLDEDVVRGFIAEAVAADGAAGSLRIRGFASMDEECAVWPAVALSADSSRSWTVAFQRGVASPIILRPIESLPPADSARLAVQLTRLATLLPNDTSRAFRGLPFVIRAGRDRGRHRRSCPTRQRRSESARGNVTPDRGPRVTDGGMARRVLGARLGRRGARRARHSPCSGKSRPSSAPDSGNRAHGCGLGHLRLHPAIRRWCLARELGERSLGLLRGCGRARLFGPSGDATLHYAGHDSTQEITKTMRGE